MDLMREQERDDLAHLIDERIITVFQVTDVSDFEVTIEDENRNTSHVHQQGDGKWKCQRCDRYRCEHVKFVQQRGVQLMPRVPVQSDDIEILTF